MVGRQAERTVTSRAAVCSSRAGADDATALPIRELRSGGVAARNVGTACGTPPALGMECRGGRFDRARVPAEARRARAHAPRLPDAAGHFVVLEGLRRVDLV